MFVRGRYGHGGRIGYDKEWRADPARLRRRRAHRPGRAPDRSRALVPRRLHAGRGLRRHLFLGHAGRRQRVPAAAHGRRPDGVRCTSAAPSGRTSSRSRSTAGQASCRSTGLGGSYGVERLTFYQMLPRDGAARDARLGISRRRTSRGTIEFADFVDDIRLRSPDAGLGLARRARRRSKSSARSIAGHAPMIITRSPLRITLGGGGTDLPSYYREHGGFLIAAAIDKYVYVTVMRPFAPGSILKYSKLEHVDRVDEVQHPIIREALRMLELRHAADRDHDARRHPGRHRASARPAASRRRCSRRSTRIAGDCSTRASSPSSPATSRSTGSASRSASRTSTSPRSAASPASPSTPDDTVEAEPLATRHETRCFDLEDNLLLFFTGFSRSAGDDPQGPEHAHASRATPRCSRNLHYVKELGLRSREALEARRPAPLRRADARALGAQEAALAAA